jgi:hypothetical protein
MASMSLSNRLRCKLIMENTGDASHPLDKQKGIKENFKVSW